MVMKNTRTSLRGFSLIELMVAMGILSVLLILMAGLLDAVQKVWVRSEGRITQFREARVAFDLLSKNLGQASLNTYWDLVDKDGDGDPERYEKISDLNFLTVDASSVSSGMPGHAVFFQAPLGFSLKYRNLTNLFNGRGYFVQFDNDEKLRPKFVKSEGKYRFRLMEFRPPAEDNQVFEDGYEERKDGMDPVFSKWFKQGVNGVGNGGFSDFLNPLADNVILLVVSPRDSLEDVSEDRRDTFSKIAPRYSFDSNSSSPGFEGFNQEVPPLVRLTMIAIDENAAIKIAGENGSKMPDLLPSGLFQQTSKYEDDVLVAVKALNEAKISHKVFSTIVMLRSAKWSTLDPSVNGNE